MIPPPSPLASASIRPLSILLVLLVGCRSDGDRAAEWLDKHSNLAGYSEYPDWQPGIADLRRRIQDGTVPPDSASVQDELEEYARTWPAQHPDRAGAVDSAQAYVRQARAYLASYDAVAKGRERDDERNRCVERKRREVQREHGYSPGES